MNARLALDYALAMRTLTDADLASAVDLVLEAGRLLESRSGPGSEFLGWLDLPVTAPAEVPSILRAAARLRDTTDAIVVIGIGGSHLGARAVIDACRDPFARTGPEILYAGHQISGGYLSSLLSHLEGRRFALNVISKSGTTTEPALAFRVLKRRLEQRVGADGARTRIVATTDASRGALRALSNAEGYETFVIPDDVGGRFSVLTPVGLLPIACAGIDIEALLDGAQAMRERVRHADASSNPAVLYAALRTALSVRGMSIEILASFEPALGSIAEWWKQLFGESEGKHGKGLFPASVVNTTDLHSMGQYIQDGRRALFETFLVAAAHADDTIVPAETDDIDGMNYLAGTTLSAINAKALLGTALAHADGGVPSSTITLPDLSPRSIGELLYFFEYAVALSGYALGVNPFDQPGVELYKRNMFHLLGKPGASAPTAAGNDDASAGRYRAD